MLLLQETRKIFLDFFIRNGHEAISSSPLIPDKDPTLLFTNAGMVQFKNIFTGAETREYQRATSSQKCLRAGGKHNDLDNVGYTARHHTFFEMLGNFSFGNYFKEEAIVLAWECITKVFSLPQERLLITVFSEDQEARNLWKKVSGLSESRILGIKGEDNFWSMGDRGPCGPCSEIFYDHGEEIAGGPPGSENEDGDRFVEIWNLVFMQFERINEKNRIDLPKPSVDTGMGLERMAAVLQGVHDNYAIDLFQRLIEASVEETQVKAEGEARFSHRIIADHLRAASFLIAEGLTPSNEGRGYVLRRIMRRAMRHAHLLGSKDPLMHRLVPALVEAMGGSYPELKHAGVFIQQTLLTEEERFLRTLGRGMEILENAASTLSSKDKLSGETAFKLYDTYGFPLDLTQDILRSRGVGVDVESFSLHMKQQKERARKAWKGSGDQKEEKSWLSLGEKYPETVFLGYTSLRTSAKVLAILRDGTKTDRANKGDCVELLFDQTSFYAESGGQDADRGEIIFDNGARAFVRDIQKKANRFSHKVDIIEGVVEEGITGSLVVDEDIRKTICANHSAAHILHAALREVLGSQVTQKGQKVNEERLRFDFSFSRALSNEEIFEIEDRVNTIIRQNVASRVEIMSLEQAREKGALALFGEKYGTHVRVLTIGYKPEDTDQAYSMELCGGTHVTRSGDIALFKITSESAVAAGIRRIEAVTGERALHYIREQTVLAQKAASLLRASVTDLPLRIKSLLKEKKNFERSLIEIKKKLVSGQEKTDSSQIEKVGKFSFKGQILEGVEAKEVPSLMDESKKQIKSGIVTLVALNGEKASLAVGITKDLVSRFSAIHLVRMASVVIGGKGGGGRPDFAMAGGTADKKKVELVFNTIRKEIESTE